MRHAVPCGSHRRRHLFPHISVKTKTWTARAAIPACAGVDRH
jgi:hypothetical protein